MKRKSQNKKEVEKKVKIYSTPTCIWCEKTKEFLKQKGIEFEDIDVSSDKKKAKEMIDISGQMGVPVIVIGKEVIIGYDQEKLEERLGV